MEAEAKRKAREEKLAYEAARAQEAVDKTSVTEHDIAQLQTVLRTAVVDRSPLTFEALRQEFTAPAFTPKGRNRPAPAPRWEEYEPEPPRGLLGALGFGRRGYEAEAELARPALRPGTPGAHPRGEEAGGQAGGGPGSA